MSQNLHTAGDVIITPYKFLRIDELRIVKELNEHATLHISGVIPDSEVDKYVENADSGEIIKVFLKVGQEQPLLFQGVVTNIAIKASMDVRSITVKALSSTFSMDIKKKKRSFQNKDAKYEEIFNTIAGEYKSTDSIDKASNGGTTGGLLVQYNETDWEFTKRLASHFNAPLIPVSMLEGIKYYIGIPELPSEYTIDSFNYSIQKDLKSFKLKSENDIEDINEQDLVSYEITDYKVLELGSTAKFQNRDLYVYRAETVMEGSGIINRYILRDKKGFGLRKLFNLLFAGLSLFGKVLDVVNDTIKIHLDIDSEQAKGEAMWFAYSTIYSSPDGSGWYCMPEVGDQVRLYFPDNDEKNAFSASSVHLESSEPQKRSDPSVKSITTKYGKQIIFQKGSIDIICNGKQLMRLTDDGGIEIRTDKKMYFDAKEGIEISGEKVIILGKEGIDLQQANAKMTIKDNVTISGAKVNIE